MKIWPRQLLENALVGKKFIKCPSCNRKYYDIYGERIQPEFVENQTIKKILISHNLDDDALILLGFEGCHISLYLDDIIEIE